jgi:hypothetical protein
LYVQLSSFLFEFLFHSFKEKGSQEEKEEKSQEEKSRGEIKRRNQEEKSRGEIKRRVLRRRGEYRAVKRTLDLYYLILLQNRTKYYKSLRQFI